jgi:hypothetical protein
MRPGGQRTAIVQPRLGYGQGLVLVFNIELTSAQ